MRSPAGAPESAALAEKVTPEYVLGADESERARLLAQCQMHRSQAERLLDRVEVKRGARALDLFVGIFRERILDGERLAEAELDDLTRQLERHPRPRSSSTHCSSGMGS